MVLAQNLCPVLVKREQLGLGCSEGGSLVGHVLRPTCFGTARGLSELFLIQRGKMCGEKV